MDRVADLLLNGLLYQ